MGGGARGKAECRHVTRAECARTGPGNYWRIGGRGGSTGPERLGLRAAGMRRRIEFFGAEDGKEKEDLAFCQEGRLRIERERKIERDREARLFRLIKRIVGRFPFHAAVYYYSKFLIDRIRQYPIQYYVSVIELYKHRKNIRNDSKGRELNVETCANLFTFLQTRL